MISFAPFPVLETERLILRKLTLADSLDAFAMRADPRMHRYTDTKPDQTISETESYIRKMTQGVDEGKWIIWAMERKDTHRVVGIVSIWNLDERHGTGDLGYGVHPDDQGQGLMKEALLKVASFGFEQMRLHTLTAFTEEGNLPSKKLLENCRFQETGRADDTGENNDQVYHMIEYTLENTMELYIVDAFTSRIFGGNQAGVVLLREEQGYPGDSTMREIASELKHSETAFVKALSPDVLQIRYFTPECEVDLCGHATVSAFIALREENKICVGEYTAKTNAGDLRVSVEPEIVWLEMPRVKRKETLSEKKASRLYSAFALDPSVQPKHILPCVVDAGLPDILLPVNSEEALDRAVLNRAEIARISEETRVVGVHLFFCPPESKFTAICRNFAPLCGIDEECATGTSNASLTYYMSDLNLIRKERINLFLQGKSMGKPCEIFSKMDEDGTVFIGGNAKVSVKGKLML